jgi:hypothetical protein
MDKELQAAHRTIRDLQRVPCEMWGTPCGMTPYDLYFKC